MLMYPQNVSNQRLPVKRRGLDVAVGIALILFCLSGCTPAGPRALLQGKKLIEQRKFEKAVDKLTVAVDLLRTNAQAFNYLGLAYHCAGRPMEAQRAYQRA